MKTRTARRRDLIFQNAHRAQARAHFSKCARAGESSILPTQDGAHDHVSKQNEHRAEAGAPFSIKKCTAHTREAQKVKTEPRKCSRCSGAHPTNLSLDLPNVRGAWQGAAEPRHSLTPQKITHAPKNSLMFLIHVLKRSISYDKWSERTKFQ